MPSPAVNASLVSAGADILSGAFGGGSSNARMEKDLRSQYSIARQYSGAGLSNYVENAKKAGLHPLFAMGSAAGQSPTFSMPGQSPSGSFAGDGLKAVGRHFNRVATLEAQKELIEAQNQASALRVAENRISNDTSNALSNIPRLRAEASQGLGEYKPADIGSHVKGNKFETGAERSPMTGIRFGNQTIQFPIEEPDQLLEDPAAALVGAYFYKGNKHVDWKKAARDYVGMSPPWKYKNQPESVVMKKILWGLAKYGRHYKRTVGR